MRYLLSLSLIFLMSCSALKKNTKGDTADLKSTSWKLVSITGYELEATPKPVTLAFADSNKVNGNGGCNGYFGKFEVKGNELHFGAIISTKMACVPGMETETHFFKVVQETNAYEVKSNQLILKKNEEVLAVFSKVEK